MKMGAGGWVGTGVGHPDISTLTTGRARSRESTNTAVNAAASHRRQSPPLGADHRATTQATAPMLRLAKITTRTATGLENASTLVPLIVAAPSPASPAG